MRSGRAKTPGWSGRVEILTSPSFRKRHKCTRFREPHGEIPHLHFLTECRVDTEKKSLVASIFLQFLKKSTCGLTGFQNFDIITCNGYSQDLPFSQIQEKKVLPLLNFFRDLCFIQSYIWVLFLPLGLSLFSQQSSFMIIHLLSKENPCMQNILLLIAYREHKKKTFFFTRRQRKILQIKNSSPNYAPLRWFDCHVFNEQHICI